MSEVLQANVFFIITSVAVVVFTLLLCVALYHIIKILSSVKRIVARIEEGSEVIAEDLGELHTFFKEGSIISHIFGLFMSMREGKESRRKSSKKKTSK